MILLFERPGALSLIGNYTMNGGNLRTERRQVVHCRQEALMKECPIRPGDTRPGLRGVAHYHITVPCPTAP